LVSITVLYVFLDPCLVLLIADGEGATKGGVFVAAEPVIVPRFTPLL
jgi:hypothetical protein